MKKLIQMLTLCVMAGVLAVPAFARLNSEHATDQVQQDDDAKAALYLKVTENITKNQPLAYEAAKEYVQKWPNDTDQIATYLKDFVVKYEKAMLKQNCIKLLGEKKWPEAFPICKQAATDQPDDLANNLNFAWAGLQLGLSGNFTNSSDSTNAAMTTIKLIEAGKTPEAGKPYADKDKQEALGWLNYSLGLYNEKTGKAAEAAASFIKSAGYESSIKTNPGTYVKLATVYESEYGRLQESYDAIYKGKPETEESKAALKQIKEFLDPMIDAYARAVAYSGETPANSQTKTAAKQRLAELYKFAKGSEDGMDALIASVKTKPIPPHPSATATVPAAPATTSVPATGDKTVAAGTTTGGAAGAPTTAPATTPAAGAPATTPAATPATTPAAAPATTPATKPSTAQTGTQEKKPATTPVSNNGRPRR